MKFKIEYFWKKNSTDCKIKSKLFSLFLFSFPLLIKSHHKIRYSLPYRQYDHILPYQIAPISESEKAAQVKSGESSRTFFVVRIRNYKSVCLHMYIKKIFQGVLNFFLREERTLSRELEKLLILFNIKIKIIFENYQNIFLQQNND